MHKKEKLKKIKEIANQLFFDAQKHAKSSKSRGKPWHKRSDLSGLCQLTSEWLVNELKKEKIPCKKIKGNFDIQKAGGNGFKVESKTVTHYWVEAIINEETIIIDITNKQFTKYLNPFKLPPTPLIKNINSSHARPYTKIPSKTISIKKKVKEGVEPLSLD
jgi:hypothetical protein